MILFLVLRFSRFIFSCNVFGIIVSRVSVFSTPFTTLIKQIITSNNSGFTIEPCFIQINVSGINKEDSKNIDRQDKLKNLTTDKIKPYHKPTERSTKQSILVPRCKK